MLTVQEIENWLKAQRMTRKELAEALHVNYKALCQVLAAKRPVSARFSATVRELMAQRAAGLQVTVPAEIAPVLKTWAGAAGISVDRLVHELLADVLKVTLPPRE